MWLAGRRSRCVDGLLSCMLDNYEHGEQNLVLYKMLWTQIKEAVLVEMEGGSVSYAETCSIALKTINPSIYLTVLQIQSK